MKHSPTFSYNQFQLGTSRSAMIESTRDDQHTSTELADLTEQYAAMYRESQRLAKELKTLKRDILSLKDEVGEIRNRDNDVIAFVAWTPIQTRLNTTDLKKDYSELCEAYLYKTEPSLTIKIA